MTLQEAKQIVSDMSAYIGDGYDDTSLTIDGSVTLQELKALRVMIEAEGVNFNLGL